MENQEVKKVILVNEDGTEEVIENGFFAEINEENGELSVSLVGNMKNKGKLALLVHSIICFADQTGILNILEQYYSNRIEEGDEQYE